MYSNIFYNIDNIVFLSVGRLHNVSYYTVFYVYYNIIYWTTTWAKKIRVKSPDLFCDPVPSGELLYDFTINRTVELTDDLIRCTSGCREITHYTKILRSDRTTTTTNNGYNNYNNIVNDRFEKVKKKKFQNLRLRSH